MVVNIQMKVESDDTHFNMLIEASTRLETKDLVVHIQLIVCELGHKINNAQYIANTDDNQLSKFQRVLESANISVLIAMLQMFTGELSNREETK